METKTISQMKEVSVSTEHPRNLSQSAEQAGSKKENLALGKEASRTSSPGTPMRLHV